MGSPPEMANPQHLTISLQDEYSRHILHWEIHDTMAEAQVDMILQRGREAFPGVTPRIISDNWPQFVARDFKCLCVCLA